MNPGDQIQAHFLAQNHSFDLGNKDAEEEGERRLFFCGNDGFTYDAVLPGISTYAIDRLSRQIRYRTLFCLPVASPSEQSYPDEKLKPRLMNFLICYRPGTKDSPQESQTLSKRLASTNKKVTEVFQKVLCDIHAAKIIQLVARSKFT